MQNHQRSQLLGRRRSFNRDRPDGGGRDGDTRDEAALRPKRGAFVHSARYRDLERELNKTAEGERLLKDLLSQRAEEGTEKFLLSNGCEGLVMSGNLSGLRQAMRRDNKAALEAAEA